MENEEKLTSTPANMQIEESRNSLIIKYKWSKVVGYVFIAFSIFWLGFINFGFLSDMGGDAFSWLMIVFMLPFIGVGFLVFYIGLANIFNTTTITIDYDNVGIKHAPLFWLGNKNIFKHDIKQIYVKEHVHKGKNGTTYSYSVNAIDRDNKDIKLVDSLQKAEEGKWIEQKMETFLKIQDKRTSGEYNGTLNALIGKSSNLQR